MLILVTLLQRLFSKYFSNTENVLKANSEIILLVNNGESFMYLQAMCE